MKILLVGDYPDDPRLGSAKVYHKLRQELQGLGHECHVLFADAIGGGKMPARARWAASPVLAARAVARHVAAQGRVDVIDVASAEGFVVGLQQRFGRTGRPGMAVVSRSHGLEHLNYQRMLADAEAGLVAKQWYRRVWYPAVRLSQVGGAARFADRLLVLNERERQFAIDRGWKAPDEVDVVPHGVSASFLAGAPPADAPRGGGILFCGTWDPTKGAHYLVQAFTELARAREDARLTVLGPGHARERVLGDFPGDVRPRVTVVGRTDEDEVMRHYRSHDVLVFASTYEGFGMVLVEAMSQGLPVVATPTGCAPALVRHDVTGLLVPARDAPALASALRELHDDRPRRLRLAGAARAVVATMSWTATATRTVDVYARAIAARRAVPA